MKYYGVGLSDISIFVPEAEMDLHDLVRKRVEDNPELEPYLTGALEKTGQRKIRFPRPWEDTATLAAEAAYPMLSRHARTAGLRFAVVGTETGIDHSKPVSAYMLGMLEDHGVPVPRQVSSYEVQHACAGGTLAMLGIAGLLFTGGKEGESGLAVCSDIARYDIATTAEITQGAGAAALLVEQNPRLLEFGMDAIGYGSANVDDFFRPLPSKTARVKGRYSITCYNEALDTAFLDHCSRRGEEPAAVIDSTDYFVLHTPFRTMPIKSLEWLIAKHTGRDKAALDTVLQENGFHDSLEAIADIGNMYTGSAFMTLANLLKQQYDRLGDGIVGKTVLFGSYGSGNTMVMLPARIAESAPEVISRWDLDTIFSSAKPADQTEYDQWINLPASGADLNPLLNGGGEGFRLVHVREDGYREYA